MTALPVYFYLPCLKSQFERLPRLLEEYSTWQVTETEFSPFIGRYHWVLQTYLQLLAAGARVELVRELPAEGIVISHVECIEYGFRPSPKMMLVSLLVDKDIPSPHAAMHVTHNPVQRLPLFLRQHYMPPWSQIGLIPRRAARGARFETVAFVGYPENLHPALACEGFARSLGNFGLRLVVPPPAQWHDFSEIDVVLAIRTFGCAERHLNKPALKLYNAWLARVPAVLGFESAYRIEGQSGVNYLEATNADEVLHALRQLRDQPQLRASLVFEGVKQITALSESHLRARWIDLLTARLLPLYSRWSRNPLFRISFRIAGAVRERLLWRWPT
ncbi:MAG: hypothetical protein H7274_01045 [Rhodoferax sp.]|nr:hypothetical protein [Rhodoferax sp.]